MKNLEVLEEFGDFQLGEVAIRDEYGRVVRTRFVVLRNETRIGPEFEELKDARELFERVKVDNG